MSFSKKAAFIALLSFLWYGKAFATNYYFLPEGSGNYSGANWQNALPEDDINTTLDGLLAGDTLNMGSGAYSTSLFIKVSGLANNPIVIQGVDLGSGIPHITGSWQRADPGTSNNSWAGIQINEGQDFLVIKNFSLEKFMHAVNIKEGLNEGLEIARIFTKNTREGIRLKEVTNSTIRDCEFINYSKRGIRFEIANSFIQVENCFADCIAGNPTWAAESYPFGFMIESNEGNHDITYQNCISQNNYHERGSGDYWNGDGFTIENSAYNIRFINCEAYGNSDGGWDDKSGNSYYENCISSDNKRNYRIWYGPATFKNCLSAFANKKGGSGSSDGIWTNGVLDLENMTFYNCGSNDIYNEGGPVTAANCIFFHSPEYSTNFPQINEGSGNVYFDQSATITDPQIAQVADTWRNENKKAFNSGLYGSAKGYFYGEDENYSLLIPSVSFVKVPNVLISPEETMKVEVENSTPSITIDSVSLLLNQVLVRTIAAPAYAWGEEPVIDHELVNNPMGDYLLEVLAYGSYGYTGYLKTEVKILDLNNCNAISASNSQEGNEHPKAFDNDLSTRWSVFGYGEWIQKDFVCENKRVTGVSVAVYLGDTRTHHFDVMGSLDGFSFFEIKTGLETSGSTNNLEYFSLPETEVRVLRIVGQGLEGNEWNAFTEIDIETRDVITSSTPHLDRFTLPYPNPVSDRLQIGEGQLVAFRNLNGEKIQLQNQNGILDMSNLPPGLYLIELSLKGKRQTMKISKR